MVNFAEPEHRHAKTWNELIGREIGLSSDRKHLWDGDVASVTAGTTRYGFYAMQKTVGALVRVT